MKIKEAEQKRIQEENKMKFVQDSEYEKALKADLERQAEEDKIKYKAMVEKKYAQKKEGEELKNMRLARFGRFS